MNLHERVLDEILGDAAVARDQREVALQISRERQVELFERVEPAGLVRDHQPDEPRLVLARIALTRHARGRIRHHRYSPQHARKLLVSSMDCTRS